MARQAIIQCSTSDPFLSSSSSSKTRIQSSNRSTSTGSRSNKSVYWLQWSNVSKLGSLISIGRKSTDSGSRHSDLTEESLEAHNRRQEEIIFQSHRISVDDRNAKCSPYYKGLTDYSLQINREKHQFFPSPGHESHATATTTNTSISSFVLVKMQEWSSCFLSNKVNKENNILILPPPPDFPLAPPPPDPQNVTSHARVSLSPEMQTERKGPDKCVLSVINEEKPLRERVSISESELPSLTNIVGDDMKETVGKVQVDGRKFRWADKYRPKALKDFICNRSTAARMQTLMMMKGVECNHFIFEGPAGVGKRTMIWAMLQETYGTSILQTREEIKAFNLKGESVGTIEVRMMISSHHIEVNLSDLKGYEKHVIVDLIKGKSQSKSKSDPCRAIILYNADKLSADAVLYIKWLLERYKGSSKFIFCCSDVSKLQPIKEICTFVQLFLPSKEEILEVLEFIAKQEGIVIPRKFAERIADHSKNNFRQAIRALEASWERSYPFTEDEEIYTGWEDDIANIAMDIIQEQSPKQLYIIRGKLQNLIEHDVSPDFIFQTLKEELKKHLDGMSKVLLENLYKDYHRKDGNMLEGQNQLMFSNNRHEDPSRKKFYQFMNIEEFIAKFMSFYKSHITS